MTDPNEPNECPRGIARLHLANRGLCSLAFMARIALEEKIDLETLTKEVSGLLETHYNELSGWTQSRKD